MKYIYILIISLILTSCDGGLEPMPKSTIRGVVLYQNEWLPDSTIKDIRVVAFKNFPPNDIITEVLSGEAVFSEPLTPFFTDSASFIIEIPDAPVMYNYIAVARQYGSLFEWDAIGVYTDDYIDFTPKSLFIQKHSTETINIKVDFNNYPPQPFSF